MWPSREPRPLRSRFIGIWKVRIICIIFKVKHVFSRSFTHNTHAKKLTFHHVPLELVLSWWKQRPKSNQNSPNHYWLHEHMTIFHVLELCSSIQIPFWQIRPRSITCHFPVKNLHLITYSNRIGINKTYWRHCLKNFDLSLQDGLSSLFFLSHLKIDLEPNRLSIISVLIKQDCAATRLARKAQFWE